MSLLLWGGVEHDGKIQRFDCWRKPLDTRSPRARAGLGYFGATSIEPGKFQRFDCWRKPLDTRSERPRVGVCYFGREKGVDSRSDAFGRAGWDRRRSGLR